MVKTLWVRFVEALMYPFVYMAETKSILRQRESTAQIEVIAELQDKQLEVMQKMQESTTQLMAEVAKTSATSSEVLKTWLEGFKTVEVPKAYEFAKPDDEMLEELKNEYRMENPDTFELAEMTKGLLEGFRFDQ